VNQQLKVCANGSTVERMHSNVGIGLSKLKHFFKNADVWLIGHISRKMFVYTGAVPWLDQQRLMQPVDRVNSVLSKH